MNRKIYLFYAFQVIAFFLAFNMNAQNVISIGGPTSVCVGETKTYSTSGYGSVTWSVTGGGVIKGSNVGVFVSVQWNGNGTLNADYCYWIDPPEECHDGQVPCEPDVQPPCYGQICDDPPPYSVCDHGDLSVITNAYPPVPAITGLLSKAIPGATILTASNGTSYQWLRDGVAIPGATNTQFMSVASGTYKVRSTNVTTGCATESTETIVNGNDKNFSVSNNLLIPGITTEAQLHAQQLNNGSNLGYVNQSVSYADDLGKPIESVQVQSSPARKDIIGFKDFDALGREAKKWLPYTSGQASGMFVAVSTAISNQSTFFTALNDKIVDDTSPFATTAFENSPLSSAIGQKGVGNYWQSNNIGTAASYGSNSETTVLNWSMNGIAGSPIASSPTYYTASALTKALGIDENSIHSETYTDLQGRKILLRTDLGGGVWAETYYAYNRKNNLTFMLPPQLVKLLKDANSFAPTQAQLDTWAYQYKYDNLGRQIESKAPGAGWVYTVYDQRDRVVLTQDGNQRTNNEWSYTKYDDLNRPVISGIYRPGSAISRTTMQATVDAVSSGLGYQNLDPQARVISGVKVGLDVIVNGYENVNEYKAVNSIILKPGFTFTAGTTATAFRASIDDGSATATSADVFPTTNDEALVISYYDAYTHCGICQDANYQFVTESGWNGPCNEPFQPFNRIKDQTVASSVKVLGSQPSWLNTVTYYNRWGQVIQTIGANYLGGRDRVSSLVDFSGKTLEQLQTAMGYNNGGVNTVRKRYSYDHTGRVINTYHKINNQTEVILSSLEYNELGQMVRKKLHSADNGSTFLQNLDYRYNIRGWLTNKNNIPSTGDVGDDTNDYFGMDLNYNNTIAGAGNTPRTDGMISALKYKHDLSDKKRLYNFSYDNLGRLTNAAHKMSPNNGATWGNETDFFNEAANYDQNGNITNLSRNEETFNGTSYIADPVDNLAYNYGSGGNQLQFVQDNSSSANNKNLGFKDGGTNTASDPDYAYDANGNVTKDQNKGITNITYYFNNLPSRVTFSDGSYLQNTYDAAGIKLKSYYYKAAIGATPEVAITTDYVGSMVLLNGEVLNINHEEGRITAPTYSNLMDNREAGSTSGFAPTRSSSNKIENVTLQSIYQNNQTYVKASCDDIYAIMAGVHISTTKGYGYPVKAGENYSFKVLGYQEEGETASLYVISDTGNVVWGGALPQGAANENWVTATFTIPTGVTSIRLSVLWRGLARGKALYINRVALYKTDFEYNYFITDQVGSPRVVLQTNPATITYTATMEPKNQSTEGSQFLNMTATSLVASPGNTTPGGSTVVRLNMSNKVGPAKILKVYPGDVINASAYSFYITQGSYTAGTSSGVGAAVAQAFGGTLNALGDPGAIYKNVTEAYNGGVGGLLFDRGNSNYPSAYINYILFDKDYKPLGGQSVPISTTPNTPQPLALSTITANEIGYVYIYLSYDNASGGDVFFDDFKITVTESPVIQVNSYYPFGLQAYTWLREGETNNAYLFQGKELIAQTGWHDFGSRMYWADLGRWFGSDPQGSKMPGISNYASMMNNPVMYADPDGELPILIPIAIGVIAGGYSGYKIGEAKGAKGWQMAGYILGGAAIGGIAGYSGATIAASGGAFSTTGSIAYASTFNSMGMAALSGGQTPIVTSFGGFSYDWTNSELGYLGKRGNSTLENVGYGFGALANIQDIVAGVNGTNIDVKARPKLAGHSQSNGKYEHIDGYDLNGNPIYKTNDITISVGPADHSIGQGNGLKWEMEYVKRTLQGNSVAGENVSYIRSGDAQLVTRLNNVNGKWLSSMTNRLNNGQNLLNTGALKYGLFNGCVNYNARALLFAGVLNVNAFLPVTAPVLLNAELALRQIGIYASPYLINTYR